MEAKQSTGFSLVELMVVVAIIGMLAAIGIPQYAKFRAKARQSEAKTTLGGIYTASRSFKYEWDTYSNNLLILGYGVEGKDLRYISGFRSGIPCANSVGYMGPPEGTPDPDVTWTSNNTTVNSPPTANSPNATWLGGLTFSNHATAVGTVCNQSNFTAIAVGEPRNPGAVNIDLSNATDADRWSIDQNKYIAILNNGVN